MEKSEKVEAYYAEEHPFQNGISILRKLALEAGAEETYKWSTPVYMANDKNIFWISRFKNHFSLGFFEGASLRDTKDLLENAQPGKTKAMRHLKFTSEDTIDPTFVMEYMKESLANAKG